MRAKEFIHEAKRTNTPGAETKPTMPAGTVRVDVGDVYDWYKLGQHISNLDGLGKHDFGKGPPSTIISFGSEEEEHEYIKNLKKTGLTTTDIDPKDPKQPKGMKKQKVDPTYNVGEGWKSTVASAALAGAAAFGTPAQATDLPDMMAVVKMNVKGQTINKEFNLGNEFASTQEAEKALSKFLREKGITDYFISIQRQSTNENFADGKNPQDKGDSKRHGIAKGSSIAQLKKIRSSDSASARKKQLAHWQINMKQGKNK